MYKPVAVIIANPIGAFPAQEELSPELNLINPGQLVLYRSTQDDVGRGAEEGVQEVGQLERAQTM